MIGRKTLSRLETMLEDAIDGTFQESDYDESVLSRIECKWKRFLGASAFSREAVEREKNYVKEFVSDISHQTKTPMANIRLYTELLREGLTAPGGESGENGEQNLRLLQEIEKQTEKLEFLIQSLTKLSRLESNIVEVKPCMQGIGELIEAALADVRPLAKKKDIELISLPEGEEKACFDMKWTKEALGNVLDNAIKYSPPKSQVTVSVTRYEMYTAVSVRDRGMGIKEEDTAKIFGRFYRAKTVHQEEGVGLGLYLAREIVRRESGYIKERSKPGKGAEFTIYLQNSR